MKSIPCAKRPERNYLDPAYTNYPTLANARYQPENSLTLCLLLAKSGHKHITQAYPCKRSMIWQGLSPAEDGEVIMDNSGHWVEMVSVV
jgi:hypothetical protein